jgi:hypothetical protein
MQNAPMFGIKNNSFSHLSNLRYHGWSRNHHQLQQNAGNIFYNNYGFYCDCPACPKPAAAKENAKMLAGALH